MPGTGVTGELPRTAGPSGHDAGRPDSWSCRCYNAVMDIVTAITGASGALYAQRFIQGLVGAGVNVHLVVSPLGRRLLHDELGMESIDLAALAGAEAHTITLYNYNDVG